MDNGNVCNVWVRNMLYLLMIMLVSPVHGSTGMHLVSL
jgi:hypothetical protein